MLFWKVFYFSILLLVINNLIYNSYKLLFLILNTELVTITIIFFLLYISIYYNIYWFIGLALVYLSLSGLELSLCMLIINL